MTTPSDRLLLVVPCFEEATRLPAFLKELEGVLSRDASLSLLIVDDGSSMAAWEQTNRLVTGLRQSLPGVREPLRLPRNQGKGAAIYAGWAHNEGEEWLAFVDADGSCSAQEIVRLAAMLRDLPFRTGALFASRIKMLGRRVERHLHRHLLGRVYATLVSNLLDIEAYDSQCGLKFVRRAAYEAVRDKLTLHRFAFDIDLLTSLLDAGYDVREEPIDWHEVAGGKVHLIKDSLQMLRDVMSVRRKRLALRATS